MLKAVRVAMVTAVDDNANQLFQAILILFYAVVQILV